MLQLPGGEQPIGWHVHSVVLQQFERLSDRLFVQRVRSGRSHLCSGLYEYQCRRWQLR
jgi:hypothetical protein